MGGNARGWRPPLFKVALIALGGCSLVNAPDDPVEPGSECSEPFNTLTDCGTCGVACDPANVDDPSCADGTCGYARCITGFDDCDNDATNGCEADILGDPNNCGECGDTCTTDALENVQGPACVDAACDYSACEPPWADCDGHRDNGCEFAATTLTDCGDCHVACEPANVMTATCTSGTCDYDDCRPDFQDCDGDRSNGCESDRLADADHCGSCTNPCNGLDTCDAGICKPPIFESCLDAQAKGATTSGLYTIDPNLGDPGDAFQVYCDQTTAGGGWTECFSVLNTAAEELSCNGAGFFDRCVDFEEAAWTGNEVLLTLTDTGNVQVYAAHGSVPTAWTYDLLTSPNPPTCPGSAEQYDRSYQHPNFVALDNGRFLTISGKNAGQNGWGGSWGNGYVLTVQTSLAYATNNEVTLMSYLNSSPCYSTCGGRAFQGMTEGHEVMYGPGGVVSTYADEMLQPGWAFMGTFRFLVR